MKHLIVRLRAEPVLTAAALLALASACLVPPDAGYLSYFDLRTLAILFSLMTVMAGLRRQGVFDRLGRALLARTRGVFALVLVLVGLCFFGSMLITNDVALITFVPFTFVVLDGLGPAARQRLAMPIVAMQTLAANLGSMFLPTGNPQNLYLYGKSGMTMSAFVRLMLPYSAASLLLLLVWAALLCRREAPAPAPCLRAEPGGWDRRRVILHLALFVLCLLAVIRVLPYGPVCLAVLLAALIADRPALNGVDYALLLTFAAFFVFIGNLGRLPAFSGWLSSILAGRETLVAVLASQITSNVPAALLLSGFTDNVPALIVGANLGGLGTLIASMASLISYRQAVREEPAQKGRYFLLFTLSNLLFLAVLLGVWMAVGE